MDFSAITTAAALATNGIAALLPYLVKGGEEIAKGAGKDLWELIKKLFKAAKEEHILEQLENKPDDQKLLGKVEGKLEEFLKSSPEIAREFEQKIREAKKDEERIQSLIQISHSKNVVTGSTITSGGNVTIGDGNTPQK